MDRTTAPRTASKKPLPEGFKPERMPEPKRQPVIGNMLSIDKDAPLQGLMQMTRDLGGIFRLDMMGTPIVMVSDPDIVAELSDESRFDKAVRGALRRVRAIGGDALFTGDTHAPNWQKAHNILLPTFSGSAMTGYLPMMQDVADQLLAKWERLNADDEIDVVRDMTAVALDTIGICGFDYRFNSFYRRDYHPFIDALNRTLETCMMQRGLPFEDTILRKRISQMERDVGFMNGLVDQIIRERRAGGEKGHDGAAKDLLNYMMSGVDPKTGESLSDENIRYQINTFLIAGHETTSGLMSFTLYYLLNDPKVLAKAYAEVDEVLGRDISVEPSAKQVGKLHYVQQILSESLRLWPTAPALGLYPYEDEIVGGKYLLKKGTFVNVLLLMLHRDRKVWGEDAETFDPDRFAPEEVAKRPVHAYKPFGNGQRACIGRQFAMQEATLMIALILQRFQLFDHKNYQLKIKESLSIKPDGFTMKVKLRPGVVRGTGAVKAVEAKVDTVAREKHGTPALILYGSNLGTTEEFARELTRAANLNGFDADMATLDSRTGKLPTDGVVLIACASYNGTPPDNARGFVDWLKGTDAGTLDGVNYALFGCGHSDWAATFQATPREIDEHMQRAGATAVLGRVEANAKNDLDEQFEGWLGPLWPAVGERLGLDVDFSQAVEAQALYGIEFLDADVSNPLIEQIGAQPVSVIENRELQSGADGAAPERSTRHIEVALAPGQTYAPGDHLSIVPRNPTDLVRRVEARFGLRATGFVKLTSDNGAHAALPVGRPVSLRDLLFSMVELQSPASRRDVALMAQHTRCPKTRPELERLAGEDHAAEIGKGRVSVLDLLERFPACEMPFEVFLETCPNMVPRYYSISSSPKGDPARCSITVAVVQGPSRSDGHRYEGVCSTYLAQQEVGAGLHAATRAPSAGFTLPDDPDTPIIMIGPGTGLAPFRGFCQEREANGSKGKALLFFGCRHPDQDFLYAGELNAWHKAGVIELHTAFSRKGKTRVYVQDVIREQRDKVWAMLEAGAKVFVCGDGGRMEPDVRRTLGRIAAEELDLDEAAGEAWMDRLAKDGRYALDVWVGE